jgi:hypothetical protein
MTSTAAGSSQWSSTSTPDQPRQHPARLQDQQEAAGIVFRDTVSALFGVEGLQVTDVQAGPDGMVEVWAVTDYPAAAACPACGTISGRVHETVLARP